MCLIYVMDICCWVWQQLFHSFQSCRDAQNLLASVIVSLQKSAAGSQAADVGVLLPPPAVAAHWLVDVDLLGRRPVCLRLGCICADRTFVRHNGRSFKAGLSRRPARA